MKAPRSMLASLLLVALVTQGCDAVSALAQQMLGGFNAGPTPSTAFAPAEVLLGGSVLTLPIPDTWSSVPVGELRSETAAGLLTATGDVATIDESLVASID